MKRLWIVGAGGFGREVYHWARALPACGQEWEVAGFLDANRDALSGFDYPVGVVDDPADFKPAENDLLVCALGLPRAKQSVCGDLRARRAQFLTLVHPSVIIGGNVRLGEGVVLCPGVILTADIDVGDFAMVNCQSSLGHDVRLGAWSTLSAHCDLTGRVRVGEGVFAGSGARVIPGRQVGDWATLGAGCVVTRNVRPGVTVFGAPAREICQAP